MVVDYPPGKLVVEADGAFITGVRFWNGQHEAADAYENEVTRRCAWELTEYFAGRLRTFSLPLKPGGTFFRQRVWEALTRIPYGETLSYKQLAANIGSPKAARAAGGACHHNPIVILIPCHRVIGADGALTGFGGGTAVKDYLLRLEREHAN